ncbi:TMhelix containing protein [Vibrio phage 1.223.O._10N.261.48.A9]|nr:TMhelix containing protein [Vibrio phage 1.223.O._10N.261.48.A9]
MGNINVVLLILVGTYIGAAQPSAFVNNDEYQWLMAAVIGVAMFGLLSLFDLAFIGLKHGLVLTRNFYKEIKEWLK